MPVSAAELLRLHALGLSIAQIAGVIWIQEEKPSRELGRRAEAVSVSCPTCGAAPGIACIGKRRVRVAVHIDRYQKAIAARKRK